MLSAEFSSLQLSSSPCLLSSLGWASEAALCCFTFFWRIYLIRSGPHRIISFWWTQSQLTGNQIMGMIFHHLDRSGHSEQGRENSIHECKLLASENSVALDLDLPWIFKLFSEERNTWTWPLPGIDAVLWLPFYEQVKLRLTRNSLT